jgi:arginine repressor
MSRDRGNEDRALIYTVKLDGTESDPKRRAEAFTHATKKADRHEVVCMLKHRPGKAPVVVALWRNGVREV